MPWWCLGREKVLSLLNRVRSRKPGTWDVDTSKSVLPFHPQVRAGSVARGAYVAVCMGVRTEPGAACP